MKTLFKSMMSIAVAAMAFTGCTSEPEVNPTEKTYILELVAGNTTRTEIGADNKISWSATGESLKILEQADATTPYNYDNKDYTLNGGKASFTVELTQRAGTSFRYITIHPKNAWVTSSNTDFTQIKVEVPELQLPTATSFDPNADIMVSKMITESAQPTSGLTLEFARLIALGKMQLTNLAVEAGEEVSDITLTSTGKVVTGRGKFNFETNQILTSEWGYSGQSKDYVTVMYENTAATAAFDAWFTCIPFSVAANETFTVKVTTTRGTYTRTVTVPADGALNFVRGDLTTFSVNMATAEFVPSVTDPSIFTVTFGATQSADKVDYVPTLNLGVTGSSASALTFDFSNPAEAIRKTNAFSGYDGASGAFGWWSSPNTTMTLNNVNLNGKTNFALTFAAGAGATTLQVYISKDNTNYFPLSQSPIIVEAKTTGTALLKTVNFNLNAAITENVSIKFANTTTGCKLDDLKLMPLDAPASGSNVIDWATPPSLTSTPDALTFAANNGTAGNAPEAQQITYTWGGENCTFAVTKDAADTWYTISDNNSGTITVTPQAYTATDVERTGMVTLTVSKSGVAVLTKPISITQAAQGGALSKTVTYKITSNNTVSVTGTTPEGSSASYSQTYGTAGQMTSNNSTTLTLAGYAGCKITALTLSMKSNSSKGAGNMEMKAGTTALSSIATANFNSATWAGKWSTSYVDVTPTVTDYIIQSSEDVVIKIAATVNSLYIESYTITYEK